MPVFVFKNRGNVPPVLPEGDYIVEVTDYECGVSKAKGNDMVTLHCRVDGQGNELREHLVFTESSGWKLDTFVRCVGIAPKEGETFNLTDETTIGCRGWVHIIQEEFKPKDKPAYMTNKIGMWHVDKPKLPRNQTRLEQHLEAKAEARAEELRRDMEMDGTNTATGNADNPPGEDFA